MFLLQCDNKGCGKITQALYCLDDNLVYCVDCDKSITNITIFTKNQLKTSKQIKRPKKESYSYKCHICGHQARPKLENDKLLCAKCDIHLSKMPKSFEIITKEAILNDAKDDEL